MTKTAIKIEALSKQYSLNGNKKGLLSTLFPKQKTAKSQSITVLQDLSFEVKRGEAIGIIGANGAGKSTLLKILSGVLKPSSGKVTISGTTTSILDIGAGFHPELTGRENVYLNGNLLGMPNKEIDLLFGQIAEYSGIGDFIEQPVKQYSNGMYLRLAFSVFVHLKSDILILDEVLSVGDAEFQLKSKRSIEQLLKKGISIVLVSHNMEEITSICKRCILLHEGGILKMGPASEVVEYYTEHILSRNFEQAMLLEKTGDIQRSKGQIAWKNPSTAPQNEWIRLQNINLKASGKEQDAPIFMSDDIQISLTYEKLALADVEWVLFIYDSNQSLVLSDCAGFRSNFKENTKRFEAEGKYTEQVLIPKNLLNKGIYTISFSVIIDQNIDNPVLEINDILLLKVELNPWDEGNWWGHMINASLRPVLQWEKSKLPSSPL